MQSSKGQEKNFSSDAASAKPSNKPTRPLTAYHLFFQLEREYTLQTPHDKDDVALAPPKEDDRPIGKQIDNEMPFRYRYIHLSPHWYASGSGKRINGKQQVKRKHRKTHGKISFLDLSKHISSRWAKLEETDHMTKIYVNKIARRELDVYKREMQSFKAIMVPENTTAPYTYKSCTSKSVATTEQSMPSTLKTGAEIEVEINTSPMSRRTSTKTNSYSRLDNVKCTRKEKETPDASICEADTHTSQEEYSFHLVPSSYWKQYKTSHDASIYGTNGRRESMPTLFSKSLSSTSSFRMSERMPTRFCQSLPSSPILKKSIMQNSFDTNGITSISSDHFNQNYNPARMDLENDMDSFLSRMGQVTQRGRYLSGDSQPLFYMPPRENTTYTPSQHLTDGFHNVEITADDALGLIKALSDGDE